MKVPSIFCAVHAGLLMGLLAVGRAPAQELLGSTRAQILGKFGSPLFAPRMGDEDKAEQFHVGAWEYLVGYRLDRSDPADDAKALVICVLKRHEFGAPQNLEPGDLRLALMEARNSPGWKPFDPLPYEGSGGPGEKHRDFEALHIRKSDGVLTAKAQTTRRRQRLFVFTLDWHGDPVKAAGAWFLDLPPADLRELFRGFDGGVLEKLRLLPGPRPEDRKHLRGG